LTAPQAASAGGVVIADPDSTPYGIAMRTREEANGNWTGDGFLLLSPGFNPGAIDRTIPIDVFWGGEIDGFVTLVGFRTDIPEGSLLNTTIFVFADASTGDWFVSWHPIYPSTTSPIAWGNGHVRLLP
jgi:hypothetical protein